MADLNPPPRPAGYDKRVALVLQGGGALGSYQAGVYEALAESEYPPDWVAGISIGAINAAIIAGNAPGDRVSRLRAFWEEITVPTALWPEPAVSWMGDGLRRAAAMQAIMFGQPGFFTPRAPLPWLPGGSATSYYDTAALRATLERLVDFDRINAFRTHPDQMRLSVGAVSVQSGNFRYFDSAHMDIRPEHIMASGALPPGFPPVEVDGELYWDGGLVSNTPLQYVLEYYPRRSRLTFQVDLFPSKGPVPADLMEVTEREKDIRYSSKTRAGTDNFKLMHDVKHNINELWAGLPDELRATPAARYLYAFSCVTTMDIVELIYRPSQPQGGAKDFEFSRDTMRQRWAQGRADAGVTLQASPWLAPMPPELGARTFDVVGERMPHAAGSTQTASVG